MHRDDVGGLGKCGRNDVQQNDQCLASDEHMLQHQRPSALRHIRVLSAPEADHFREIVEITRSSRQRRSSRCSQRQKHRVQRLLRRSLRSRHLSQVAISVRTYHLHEQERALTVMPSMVRDDKLDLLKRHNNPAQCQATHEQD